MIKIALCDGNMGDRQIVKKYCQDFFANKELEYRLEEYASGESFLEEDFPDVLFLEIKLEGIDGLLVKEILERKRAQTRILFLSNQRNYIMEAFGKNVFGFLLKPIDYDNFCEILKRMIEDLLRERQTVFCKGPRGIEKIYFQDICFVKSYGRYTKIYLRNKDSYLLSDQSLGDWIEETKEMSFASCHRSYLVNLAFVVQINRGVVMLDGRCLPLSKEKEKDVHNSYLNILEKRKNEKNFKNLS